MAIVEVGNEVERVVASLGENGYAIAPGVLDARTVRSARDALGEILRDAPYGRDDFEGRRTRRVYALFAKTRALDAIATHPLILGVLDRVLGSYEFSAPAAIAVGPGEVAQPLHPDDAIYPVPRPHPEFVCSAMVALDDFTEANGATRVVPGSHRWVDERPDANTATIAAEMPAGSLLFYPGTVWHGSGANQTDETRLGVVLHYAASWLRPVENHTLAVPRDTVRDLPERLAELLGYNIHPPFIGYVDGRHPRTVLQDG
jgi:ectoine hydroxylase-related dioxygenase (phytanoyl-CoA dioxygenase family)